MLVALSRLVLLARPRGALLVATLPVLGYGYALWERGSTASPMECAPTLGYMMLVWLAGHAGAMWLNAELDRDEGAVLLSRAVPVPRGTGVLAYVALVVSVLAAIPLGAVPLACVAACAVLAVLYSHPRIALKGHAVLGPLVNGVGYATVSPLAGYVVARGPLGWRPALTLAAIVLGVLGLYFAAQAFQEDEDRERGYRTLVVTHGPRRTLQVARVCFAVSMLVLLIGAAVGLYPRALLVAVVPCVLVDRWMARWARTPGDVAFASGMVQRLVVAVLVFVGAAYAHQITMLVRHLPPGGRGTAIVPSLPENTTARASQEARPGPQRVSAGQIIRTASRSPGR